LPTLTINPSLSHEGDAHRRAARHSAQNTVSLPRNFLRFLNGGLNDLAGLAADELEAEGGGALVEAAEYACPLLTL